MTAGPGRGSYVQKQGDAPPALPGTLSGGSWLRARGFHTPLGARLLKVRFEVGLLLH